MTRKNLTVITAAAAPGAARAESSSGPTDAELGDGQDEVLDEDLEAEIRALDHFRPSDHVAAGGAPRWYAILLIVGGLAGLIASIELVLSEMQLLSNPDASLACDINPVIGCGHSLLAWQSHLLFGIPNAVLGTATFGVVLGVGMVFLAGARVARWFWRLMSAVVLAGLAFVAWFAFQSFTAIGTLCPWCMVTWSVVIPTAYATLGIAAQNGALPVPERLCRVLCREKWLFTIATFLIVIVLIVVVFWNKWLLVFGL